ncbi:MAG: CvpA family protein [Oscillospiraceae bacterium]|nr:CvpA family protein [Oscillospiraceae bacterium]
MNWIMGIVIDILLLVLIAVFSFKGIRDGFAKTLVEFVSIFVAFIIALMLSAPISNFTYDKFIKNSAQQTIYTALEQKTEEGTASIEAIKNDVNEVVSKLPSIVKNLLPSEEEQNRLVEEAVKSVDITEISNNLENNVVRPAAVTVIKIIAFILLFIIASLLLSIVAKMLKFVNKIPLLGKANALLGGIIGFLKAAVFVVIISAVLSFFTVNGGTFLWFINGEMVNSSIILSRVSAINILGLIKLK